LAVPTIGVQRLAVLRLDGDMYQSTRETHQHVGNRLSVGSIVIVDDCSLGGSRAATMDKYKNYFSLHRDALVPIDADSVHWRRSAGPTLVGPHTIKWPPYGQLLRSTSVVAVLMGAGVGDNSEILASLGLDVGGA
jgi:hypothetical protein